MRCILNIELFYGAAMRVDLSLVKAYVAVVISGSDSSAVCRWPFRRCAKCVRVESGWLFMLTRMYHLQIQTCTATGMNWTTHGRQPQTNCHIIWSILYPPIKLLWLFKFYENEIEVIRKSMVSKMHWFRITTINHLAGDRPSVHMVMWIRHTNITFTFTHHVWHNS